MLENTIRNSKGYYGFIVPLSAMYSTKTAKLQDFLKENGKLGFVLPAELLQVSHAKLIREFLIKNYEKISIVSFKKLVFDTIQQDVVLLLCQKGSGIPHIEYIETEDDKTLQDLDNIIPSLGIEK